MSKSGEKPNWRNALQPNKSLFSFLVSVVVFLRYGVRSLSSTRVDSRPTVRMRGRPRKAKNITTNY